MGRTRPPYPREFRDGAVLLVRDAGKSIFQIARDLGVTEQTLRNWVKQADLDAGRRADGLTPEEREEVRRLRRENRLLREEREILKKATAFLRRQPRERLEDPIPAQQIGCLHPPKPQDDRIQQRQEPLGNVLGIVAQWETRAFVKAATQAYLLEEAVEQKRATEPGRMVSREYDSHPLGAPAMAQMRLRNAPKAFPAAPRATSL